MNNQYFQVKPNLLPEQLALVQSASKILSQRNIEIQKGEYHNKPWEKIFSLIHQSNSHKLSLYSNDAVINLKPIFMPKFTQLKELYLSCNKIVSIDSIAFLHAPNLEDLGLCNRFFQTVTNHITNIKSLRKGYFPKLKEINLSNNPILDPSPLTELTSRIIEDIHLERWPNLRMIGESKRWAVKLYPGSNVLKSLSLKSYGRRAQPHIDKMIQAKYPKWRAN